jgi:hypothetical protein
VSRGSAADETKSDPAENPEAENSSVESNLDNYVGVEETENDPGSGTEKETRMKKGPGRPRTIRTGKRGRPKKQPNMIPASAETSAVIEEQLNFSMPCDPVDVKEALSSTDKQDWWDAILEEDFTAHLSNETWEIFNYPANRKTIGSRFVLQTKLTSDGYIDRRKARLVAKVMLNCQESIFKKRSPQ